jgi:hypothetical protein
MRQSANITHQKETVLGSFEPNGKGAKATIASKI